LREFAGTLSLLINTTVYFVLSAVSDVVGRMNTLRLGTLIIWGGYIGMYFVKNYLAKLAIFGFSTGCDGTFTTLFIMGITETTGTF
jgi:hypothetical protein